MTDRCFGWTPNPPGVEDWINDPANTRPLFGLAGASLPQSRETVLLYEPLLQAHPTWRRQAQGIGDCVSWGYELGVTTLLAIMAAVRRGRWPFPGEAATEPIYGGSRVEARGRTRGGWTDGSYGAAAAKWLKTWGALLRRNYAGETGVAEHDLTTYSSRKAKQWGYYGCGGQRDAGQLDAVARLHPVRTTSLVASFDEAAQAIGAALCPVPVCSGQGFTLTRDADGFCRPRGAWAHCMLFWGVRHGQRPGLLCANSWGNSNSGPRWPAKMPDAVAACSFWVDAEVADRMLRRQDSFALSDLDGFQSRRLPDYGTGEYL